MWCSLNLWKTDTTNDNKSEWWLSMPNCLLNMFPKQKHILRFNLLPDEVCDSDVWLLISYQNLLWLLSPLWILKHVETCALYLSYMYDLCSKENRVKISLVFNEIWLITCSDSSFHLPNRLHWVERVTGPRWRPHFSCSTANGASTP